MSPNDTMPISILVVEDDLVNRTLLEGMLSESALSVAELACATSLGGALDLLGRGKFDIVLLDLNLPDSKDLDTLNAVTNQVPHTAVVVVTGEHGESLGPRAITCGAQDYLVKADFNHQMLSRSVRYAIERKRMEEEGQAAFRELEKAHAELKEMQSQMVQSEKLASIGQLAAGVAHEINTPVGFVSSNFETLENYMRKIRLLLDKYGELVAYVESSPSPLLQERLLELVQMRQTLKMDFILDDLQDLFDESREGLVRITSIIQNLRDFSRIDQAEEMGDYSLNAGIQATLAVARNEIKYDADIVTELGAIPPVPCHAGQINQVILNILVNAAQAIWSQERRGNGTITIRTYAGEGEVICEITDDGPGIPADAREKIFDPFFTTKPVGKGTGLGLSVSYNIIVNKHHGQLLVDSAPGQGTTFTLRLPTEQKRNQSPASTVEGESHHVSSQPSR